MRQSPFFSLSGQLPTSCEKRGIWSLDIRDAFLRTRGFRRDVYIRAPLERGPKDTRRYCKLHAPAYGLKAAPAVLRGAAQRYLLRLDPSLSSHSEVPAYGPHLYFLTSQWESRGRHNHTQ